MLFIGKEKGDGRLPSTLAVLSLQRTSGLGGSWCGSSGGGDSSCGVGRGRRGHSGGTSRREQVPSDTEPVKHVTLLSGDVVWDTLRTDSLEEGTVGFPSPAAHWRVVLSGDGRGWVAEDVGPLLDALSVVAVVEGGIAGFLSSSKHESRFVGRCGKQHT